jgi:hypothetical protein
MRKPYNTYAEIPELVADYVLTVADRKHIMSIPLEEINSFLDGIDQYLAEKQEEYSEGWVD